MYQLILRGARLGLGLSWLAGMLTGGLFSYALYWLGLATPQSGTLKRYISPT